MSDGASWLGRLVRDEVAKKLFWVALTGLGVWLWANYKNYDFSPLEIALTALLVVVAGGWAFVALRQRLSYKKCHYPKVKFQYEVLEKKIEYLIGGDGLLHFSRTVTLRALTDQVDSYLDKYVWTGGEAGLPVPGKGAVETTKILKAGIWTFYATRFPVTLRKGQEHEFRVEWPPISNWRASSPFVSTSTEEPTRSLKFIVQVPAPALGEPWAYWEEMRGIESAHDFDHDVIKADAGRFEWEVRPSLYRHYRLRWTWANGDKLQKMPSLEGEE